MNQHITETMSNIEEVLKNNLKLPYLATMQQPSLGYACKIYSPHRSYVLTIEIENDLDIITFELSLGIHCLESAKESCSCFLMEKNSMFKIANFNMEQTSEICMKYSQFLGGHIISQEMIDKIIHILLFSSFEHYKSIEMVSHGLKTDEDIWETSKKDAVCDINEDEYDDLDWEKI